MIQDIIAAFSVLISFFFLFHLLYFRFLEIVENKHAQNVIYGVGCGLIGYVLVVFPITTASGKIELPLFGVVIAALFRGLLPSLISCIILGPLLFLSMFPISSSQYVISSLFLIIIGVIYGIISLSRWSYWLKWTVMWLTLLVPIQFFNFSISNQTEFFPTLIFWSTIYISGSVVIYFVKFLWGTYHMMLQNNKYAYTDALTGLSNLRSFQDRLDQLFLKAKHKNEPLSLIMLDIDYFKKVNDSYGHPAGDEVLKELGKRITKIFPTQTLIARTGGEEFSILLQCKSYQGLEFAEALRELVASYPFRINENQNIDITISIGLSTFVSTMIESGLLIQQADKALYDAKQNGRNRVVQSPLE